MIEILVVEDSRVIMDYLVYALEKDPSIRVMGKAGSGEAALEFLGSHRPDAVLMDLHLPGIDGLEATRRIMSSTPVPIVICTASIRFDEIKAAMEALEAGALAILKKPRGLGETDAQKEIAEIGNTLKLMAEIKLVKRWKRDRPTEREAPSGASRTVPRDLADFDPAIVVIGASTGGPPAVSQILSALSPSFPAPILVVQHIAAGFTGGFAEWLSVSSSLPVRVALGGEIPLPGRVYVAPDDMNLRIGKGGELETARDEPRHSVRPSAGILFLSAAERFGRRGIGVLLTGMGRDGAEELKAMADSGALTFAQDEESCVVFGMPAEAIKLGAARYVLPPRKIAEFLNAFAPRGEGKGAGNG